MISIAHKTLLARSPDGAFCGLTISLTAEAVPSVVASALEDIADYFRSMVLVEGGTCDELPQAATTQPDRPFDRYVTPN